ncbi:hypothetical protein Hdeb2414_s0002g00069371 [Helianthus debilis subsp. tardiflorus]
MLTFNVYDVPASIGPLSKVALAVIHVQSMMLMRCFSPETKIMVFPTNLGLTVLPECFGRKLGFRALSGNLDAFPMKQTSLRIYDGSDILQSFVKFYLFSFGYLDGLTVMVNKNECKVHFSFSFKMRL